MPTPASDNRNHHMRSGMLPRLILTLLGAIAVIGAAVHPVAWAALGGD